MVSAVFFLLALRLNTNQPRQIPLVTCTIFCRGLTSGHHDDDDDKARSLDGSTVMVSDAVSNIMVRYSTVMIANRIMLNSLADAREQQRRQ